MPKKIPNRSKKNIFDDLNFTAQMVAAMPNSKFKSLAATVVTLSDRYFKSLKWATNDNQKAIFKLYINGLSLADIAGKLNLNVHTCRCNMSRISTEQRNSLYGGHYLSQLVSSRDTQTLLNSYNRLRFLLSVDDYITDCPNDIYAALNQKGSVTVKPEEVTTVDILNVLNFLSFYSKSVYKNYLDNLNPDAIRLVLSTLETNEYSPIYDYLEYFRNNYMHLGTTGLGAKMRDNAISYAEKKQEKLKGNRY